MEVIQEGQLPPPPYANVAAYVDIEGAALSAEEVGDEIMFEAVTREECPFHEEYLNYINPGG